MAADHKKTAAHQRPKSQEIQNLLSKLSNQSIDAAGLIASISAFQLPASQLLKNLLAYTCSQVKAEAAVIASPVTQAPVDANDLPRQPPVQGDAASDGAAHPHEFRILSHWPQETLAVEQGLGISAEAQVWLQQSIQVLDQEVREEKPITKPILKLIKPNQESDVEEESYIIIVPLLGANQQCYYGLWRFGQRKLKLARHAVNLLEQMAALFAFYDHQRAMQGSLGGVQLVSHASELLGSIQEYDRFKLAAMSLVNQIHANYQMDRVCLGILSGKYVKLRAMSHTERLNRKMKLAQDIEMAMEEVYDQETEVYWPCDPSMMIVNRDLKKLGREHGSDWACGFPLRFQNKIFGVLLVERVEEKPMTQKEGEALRLACDFVSPYLKKLYDADRWVGAKLAMQMRKTAAFAVGSEHTWLKVGTIVGAILLAVLVFGKGPDRVTATFEIDAKQHQILAAPFDGYLKTVHVSIGDEVVAGETVLANLDTSELVLEEAQYEADKLRYIKEAAIARRDGKIAEQQIAEAEANRLQAQLDQVRYRLDKSRIVSDTSGVILEGDWEQKAGVAVAKGDVLYEVVPLEGLFARVMVPEQYVHDLEVGQKGELASASHPGEYVPFEIELIEPMAEVHEQNNMFRVRVKFAQVPEWFKPGMQGVAKVEVGRVSWGWIWVRDAVNWVRMKLWI